MKKTSISLYGIYALIAVSLLYSCSKDKKEDSSSGRMLGRWNISREIEVNKNTTTGKYSDTTYDVTFPTGLFTAEFRDNGKVYFSINTNPSPSRDTSDWHIHNANTLMMDDNLYDITNWTSNSLTTTTYYWDNTDSVKQIMELNR